MNLKLVLRTYSNLRQLTDDETALLETLRAMNDGEREMLVESLSPQPQKKSSKKAAGSGKSKRAAELGDTIRSRTQQKPTTMTSDIDIFSDERCQFIRADGKPCKLLPDHNIHHLATANEYHPFVSSAQPVTNPSSASGGASGSTANSETETDGVGSAVHGASGGS